MPQCSNTSSTRRLQSLRCPKSIRREDRGDYVQEYLTFQTTPDLRVPAYVLIPKRATLPAPGIVLLHCHGGFYAWGKEKVVEVEGEPSVLTEFKQQLYGGKSIATELVRRGYVVITIDMFYWGERRMLLDDDPPSYRDPRTMTKDDIAAFNRRSQQAEQLVARSLLAAGITWPGVMLWDDLRTLDYLATPPGGRSRRGSVASGCPWVAIAASCWQPSTHASRRPSMWGGCLPSARTSSDTSSTRSA